jgi:hypothetical protein
MECTPRQLCSSWRTHMACVASSVWGGALVDVDSWLVVWRGGEKTREQTATAHMVRSAI